MPRQGIWGVFAPQRLRRDLKAKNLSHRDATAGRDGDRAYAIEAAYPAMTETRAANRRANRAGDMGPPFAPIEARLAENAPTASPAGNTEHGGVDPQPSLQENHSFFGDDAAVRRKVDKPTLRHPIRDVDRDLPGKMIITSPSQA